MSWPGGNLTLVTWGGTVPLCVRVADAPGQPESKRICSISASLSPLGFRGGAAVFRRRKASRGA